MSEFTDQMLKGLLFGAPSIVFSLALYIHFKIRNHLMRKNLQKQAWEAVRENGKRVK